MSIRNSRTGRKLNEELRENFNDLKTFINKTLPDKMQDAAQRIVDESFQNEQYQDGKSSKWKDRNNDDQAGLPRDKRRAILVKDGKLIGDVNVEKQGTDVVIGTDVVYAKRHNEGLDGMPKRQFMPIEGESNPKLDKQIEKFVDDAMDKIFGGT